MEQYHILRQREQRSFAVWLHTGHVCLGVGGDVDVDVDDGGGGGGVDVGSDRSAIFACVGLYVIM